MNVDTSEMGQHRADVLMRIEQLQSIQKTHPANCSAWIQASEMLGLLFAKMANLDRKK